VKRETTEREEVKTDAKKEGWGEREEETRRGRGSEKKEKETKRIKEYLKWGKEERGRERERGREIHLQGRRRGQG
jgi:hypothetical protein